MINNKEKLNDKVIFRKATIEDVHELVTVNLETWQSSYKDFMSKELLERRIKDRLKMEKN